MDKIDLSKVQWDPSPVIDPGKVRWDEPVKEEPGLLTNLAAGAVKGASRIGTTLLKPIDAAARVVGVQNEWIGRTDRAESIDDFMRENANPDSLTFKGADIGTQVAGTLGVGGVLGKGIAAVAPAVARGVAAVAPSVSRVLPSAGAAVSNAAPAVARAVDTLGRSVASGGFSVGKVAPVAGSGLAATVANTAANIGLRSAGGAINGAASAGLVNPDEWDTGAAWGAALPPALMATGKVAGYAGRAAGSVVKPFMPSGQDEIAGKILREFAEGGPTTVDARQLVPGSVPTLAEATGNAGLATLQRSVRDIRPNAFVEREAMNAAARSGVFDDVAGNPEAIAAAKAARDQAAKALYGRAFEADAMRQSLAKEAAASRAPFGAVGLNGARDDLATPGLRALAQRPMFAKAIEEAKVLAANNGHRLDDPLQSLEGLHYVKLALDDMLNPGAKSAMGRNASGAVESMRDELANELAKISPLYGNARQTYAEMSSPINAMEALQNLRLTDKTGNITLAKVKNAIEALERQQRMPGVNNAKALTDQQMATLKSLHEDLLRADNLTKGTSKGSNTFQNIATDNIINSVGGKWIGSLAQKSGASGVAGQVGKLLYSNPNEAIRNRLVDMILNPAAAQEALQKQQAASAIQRVLSQMEGSPAFLTTARAAPVLLSDP